MVDYLVSRRTLLGSTIAAAWPLRRAGGRSAAKSLGARPRSRMQNGTPLSIALLDRHWEAIEDLAKAQADAVGIDLKATALGYDELYAQESLALTQRAASFDIVLMADSWIPQFASFLVPLDVPGDVASVLVPLALNLGRYPADSLPCALPWLGEAQFFALRSDWLEQLGRMPPSTWDETVDSASEVAASLDSDGDLAAFGIRTLDAYQLVESFLPILRGYGKDLIDSETSVPQLDTAEALAGMQTFLDLSAMSPPESVEADAPDNADRFAHGQICMMANFWSSDLLGARAGAPPSGVAGPLATMTQPAQPGVDHRAMTGVWLSGIPSGSLAADVARAFLDWLTGRELQATLAERQLPPVRTDVLQDEQLVERFPDFPALLEMLEKSTPRARSPFYPQLEQLLASELRLALEGDESGEAAMKNANVALREFLVREGVLSA